MKVIYPQREYTYSKNKETGADGKTKFKANMFTECMYELNQQSIQLIYLI